MKIAQVTSQVAADLDQLSQLTDNCRAAVAAEDPVLLLTLMSDRQSCIDRLDAARAKGYNYCEDNYNKIKHLQDKDQALRNETETLASQFRQTLKSVRSQRFIQVYARISGNSGGNII